MGETEEQIHTEEMHEEKTEKKKEKKSKDGKKKEKNPADKKDPAKLKLKLERLDEKIKALTVKREEIVQLIAEAEQNAAQTSTAEAEAS